MNSAILNFHIKKFHRPRKMQNFSASKLSWYMVHCTYLFTRWDGMCEWYKFIVACNWLTRKFLCQFTLCYVIRYSFGVWVILNNKITKILVFGCLHYKNLYVYCMPVHCVFQLVCIHWLSIIIDCTASSMQLILAVPLPTLLGSLCVLALVSKCTWQVWCWWAKACRNCICTCIHIPWYYVVYLILTV